MGLYFRRSLIVIAILVISLIGQIALAADEKSIEIWLISTPVQGINDFYNEIAQAFKDKTGYEVNIVWVAREDMHTKLMTSVSAGIFPILL